MFIHNQCLDCQARSLQSLTPGDLNMSTIYLVRHGITPANKKNRFAGRTGEELDVEGIEQVRQVGARLLDKKIGAVYCGPTKRTLQSAEIIGSLLNIPVTVLPELDEIYIPHWDGLTKDEIRQQYGVQYPTWLSAPQNFNLPGCESLAQVQMRAVEAVNHLSATYCQQNVLIVSHLIVLRCLVLYFKGFLLNDFRSIKIDNGSILQVSEGDMGGMSVRFL
jgi:broad specificity phosphatase PhoE